MAVLVCTKCKAKVESNRCCGEPMGEMQGELFCKHCGKGININRCCGMTMSIGKL